MKKFITLFITLMMMNGMAFSQAVGISETAFTPDPSSILELKSTGKGFLVPRMSSSERANISSPAVGLLVYQTNAPTGYYFYSSTGWYQLSGGTMPAGVSGQTMRHDGTNWLANSLLFNNGTSIGIGTTTPTFKFEVSGADASMNGIRLGKGAGNRSTNTSIGFEALNANTTGDYNIACGYRVMANSTTGDNNTGLGYAALVSLTKGSGNSATGFKALYSDTTGSNNTANGYAALYYNRNGNSNTAVGMRTLYNNNNGHSNVAIGSHALYKSTQQCNLVAIGDSALFNNGYNTSYLEGWANTAIGSKSLFSNTTGSTNTAMGFLALYSNTTGNTNTTAGMLALYNNQTGSSNTVFGFQAGFGSSGNSCSNNSLFGLEAGHDLTSGSNNILFGYKSGNNLTTGSNNIIIGYDLPAPFATGNNQVVIGASNLFYGDLTNKQIGIGTSSPEGNLHLNNNGDVLFIVEADANNSGESDNPRVEVRQDGNLVRGAIGFVGSDDAVYHNSIANAMYLVNEFDSPTHFGTDSVISMTLSSIGELGIGTTEPLGKLSIEPASGVMVLPPIINYEKGLVIKDGAVNGGSDFEIQDSDGDIKFIVADDGDVGIGTSAPSCELQVIGRAKVSELEITGGSDIAEPFDTDGLENIESGMVLSIDSEHPGKLRLSDKANDHCVAGIVSGAGNIETGLILRQEGTEADGKHMVALSGRVYCWVDASFGAIQPGDMLTTSTTPGYAMKVKSHSKAQGAVIGKAMTTLDNGKGLVLVLVSLQ